MNTATATETMTQTITARTHGARAAVTHVLSMADLANRIEPIIATARALKQRKVQGALPPLLAGRSVALIFEKPSTRTRVSFEIGIQLLSGVVATIDAHGSQLGRGETLEDTAGCLSGYADALIYRAKDHGSAMELARHANIPVVNALTDLEHPCQVLADLLTLTEHFDSVGSPGLAGKTLAYVGDGNNMCHSYLVGAALTGMHLHVATPPAYAPAAAVVQQARSIARGTGSRIRVTTDPNFAVRGAQAVATDTWVSMGDEADAEARMTAFADFTVDDALLDRAAWGAVFLHCLPGHWGQEATHEVAHGPRSLIFPQAENRMWAQMALLAHLIGRKDVGAGESAAW